ncbi:unnamed protein product [Knipowitschia caucasica]
MVGVLSRRSMTQRLGILLVLLGLAWGLMLLRYTAQQPRHESSQELREQILELSHRYVRVLREEKENAPGGPQGTALVGYADLKRTIAVLLDDILGRLSKLEGKLDLTNSSSSNSSSPASAAVSRHKAPAGTARLLPQASHL